MLGRAVAQRDQGVAAQVARVAVRHVEPPVAPPQIVVRRRQPVGQRDEGLGVRIGCIRAAPRRAGVPGAHVLADVAAVDAVLERVGDVGRSIGAALRPVRQAPASRRARRARPARPSGRRRCRACRSRSRRAPGSGAAATSARVGDDGTEGDERAQAGRDRHRVLAREREARGVTRRRGRRACCGRRTRRPARPRRAARRARGCSDARSRSYGSPQAYRGRRPTAPSGRAGSGCHTSISADTTVRAPRSAVSG